MKRGDEERKKKWETKRGNGREGDETRGEDYVAKGRSRE